MNGTEADTDTAPAPLYSTRTFHAGQLIRGISTSVTLLKCRVRRECAVGMLCSDFIFADTGWESLHFCPSCCLERQKLLPVTKKRDPDDTWDGLHSCDYVDPEQVQTLGQCLFALNDDGKAC